MSTPEAMKRWKRLALFVMLVMGTILHGISVADIYRPALVKVGSLVMAMIGRAN
jgi:hypothetical protein